MAGEAFDAEPAADADTIGGLLVEACSALARTKRRPGHSGIHARPSRHERFQRAESSGGIVPAPGALLVLGLAAARRRRRRR